MQDRDGASGTRATRILAALIVLPLIVVAALIAFNRYSDRATAEQARTLTNTLDRTLTRAEAAPVLSLAVLPLLNQSKRSELDYLATGVAGEVRERLAGIAGFELIGSESSGNVADQALSVTQTARLLGASHLLRGSLAGTGQDLAIALQLYAVDGTEQLVWDQVWAGTVDTLPVTTQAIAARVIETVLPGTTGDAGLFKPLGPALNEYLLGKYLIDRYNRAEVLEGLAYLERAILEDPQFERAYAAKIAAHQRMTWIDAQSTAEHEAAIDATIDDYLALDATTPLTFRLRALRAAVAHKPLEAFAEFQRAVQLAPQEYAYDRGYMIDLCKAGYLQRCLEQARGLARRDPVSAAAHSALAMVYLLLGRYDLMLEHARLSGRFGGDLAQFYEAQALLRQGDLEQAKEVLAKALRSVGVDAGWVTPYIDALRDSSAVPAAVIALQSADEDSAAWLDLFYTEYFDIGELDRAFAAAAQLVERQFETWNLWLWEPPMAPFRDDPRFFGLMDDMGLMAAWRSLGAPDLCTGPAPEPFCAAIEAQPASD